MLVDGLYCFVSVDWAYKYSNGSEDFGTYNVLNNSSKEDLVKKPNRIAIICIVNLLCIVVVLLIAIPIFRYRIYHGDEPIFMNNPTMQKLIYHDTDIVMLQDGSDTLIYDGNTYIGVVDAEWHFDDRKMQYAGKIHHRKLLHFYCNYDVYTSENAVTEQGMPIYLVCGGQPPFYYVLEGYEVPNIMTSELSCFVYTKDNHWSLQNTAELEDLVDIHAAVSYDQEMQLICYAKLYSVKYEFMYCSARIYKYGERYYLNIMQDKYCPITLVDLIALLQQIETD